MDLTRILEWPKYVSDSDLSHSLAGVLISAGGVGGQWAGEASPRQQLLTTASMRKIKFT